jgi:hypothetical protein
MPDTEDSYEDDEPVEEIVSAWEHGTGGTTAAPTPMFVVSIQSVSMGLAYSVPREVGKMVVDGPINRGTLVAR